MAAPVSGSSLADWNALERAVDRWSSLGALALAVVAAVAFLLVRV